MNDYEMRVCIYKIINAFSTIFEIKLNFFALVSVYKSEYQKVWRMYIQISEGGMVDKIRECYNSCIIYRSFIFKIQQKLFSFSLYDPTTKFIEFSFLTFLNIENIQQIKKLTLTCKSERNI